MRKITFNYSEWLLLRQALEYYMKTMKPESEAYKEAYKLFWRITDTKDGVE